jgi:hypothetical protein
LAEVSSGNFNVSYELATRHNWVSSGTMVVRLKGVAIPFDIQDVSVTEYAHTPPSAAEKSIARIARALRETLRRDEVDSPYYDAVRAVIARMGDARNPSPMGALIVEAEDAALQKHPDEAAALYRKAVAMEPGLAPLHYRSGTLLWEAGKSREAIAEFQTVLQLSPGHLAAERMLTAVSVSADPLRPPPFLSLSKEERLDVGALMLGTSNPDRVDVRLMPEFWRDGRWHSMVRVISAPEVEMTKITELLGGFGNVDTFSPIEIPGTGRTMWTFDVVSESRNPGQLMDMKKALTELPERGNIEIKGPSGGSFGGGGRGGGSFGGVF